MVAHPGPVGIVIDEDTALVLNGSAAEAIGVGTIALVDPAKDKARPYLVLKGGDKRDLALP
jgi:cyanophycinase-like exopeptidase